ncbi:hypothetical protein HMPREF9432_01062 [Selenomonas noxia F0398]|uniref:Uncharacterized protein n=1 Tax=Selenomonas noxia F0398 TaxID=702437 RepID=A0ABP2MQJ8_9FIRM|nr:hypothetical protein HMPREF9432_01062 [Selenomonas noxia F0398]
MAEYSMGIRTPAKNLHGCRLHICIPHQKITLDCLHCTLNMTQYGQIRNRENICGYIIYFE